MTTADESRTAPPGAATNRELEAAIADAELLISYNAVHHTQLDSGAVKDVLALRKELESGSPKTETITAFWLALNALSNAATPATPSSIRLASRVDKDGKPLNRRAFSRVFWNYRIITSVFLVLAIVLNAYWILAKQTTDNLKDAYARLNTVTAEWKSANAIIDAANKSKPTTDEGKQALVQAQASLPDLSAGISQLESSVNSNLTVLSLLIFRQIDLTAKDNVSAAENANTLNDDKEDADSTSVDEAEQAVLAETILGFIRDIVGLTLVPLAFGGLGACVYVVRRISDLVAAKAFDPDTSFSFGLRVFLGCIAGLAAAQLQIFEKSTTLTPLALAFIAGYAIEVFFSALDRLVGAFSGGGQKTTQNPAGR